ncbi:hypothetical protein QP400_09460 [Winkia sp. UMB3158]|uniref:Pyridoxamine 5'-phosphate oxidase putative domain-containing protein n=2 Tax=Winkia neuii TaxID=33007 RepID=K0YUB0_9ACTO|nr:MULTISPECIES: hypothetical protein [Winkia]MDK8341311.1 hypothetical protein [Winkia sp. UMB3164B]OFT38578.1 hypothetical protein HMPREF3163_05645 [Actinomyces sp. HMSC08A01]PLB80981.1 hypothetical protein CYJ21_02000 [Actinomyces sp. UMB0138]EJZ87472.1 hypothetical protein HMPREF9240_00821 [Winkia neuii BV029A5]MBS5947332.1 hypothetical protein [Winkia neuii]
MSIPVPFTSLAQVLKNYNSATLITLREGGFAKVMTVDPILKGGKILVANPRQSIKQNVAANNHVTLLWQPLQRHGWTLIVDGYGTIVADLLEIQMHSGMLHRPRAHGDGPAATVY